MPDAEDDAGWGLAEVVRDRILAIYPSIQVEMWKSDGGRATDLYFTPERTTEVSVEVVVTDSGRFQVLAGAFSHDDADNDEQLSERLEMVVRLVLAFAGYGYAKVRIPMLLGPWAGTHVGPSGGYLGLDDVLEYPFATVVEHLDRWSTARATGSDWIDL